MRTILTAVIFGLFVAVITSTSMYAQQEKKGKSRGQNKEKRSEMREKRQAFHKEMKEKRKAHRETQKKENKAFREGLKGAEVSDKIDSIKSHHATQHKENVEFMASQHQARINFIKENAPSDRQAEILKKVEAAYNTMKEHMAKQHEENNTFLDGLKGQDLKPKEFKAQMKAHMKKQHQENKELRKSLRESCKLGKGKKGRNRKGGMRRNKRMNDDMEI